MKATRIKITDNYQGFDLYSLTDETVEFDDFGDLPDDYIVEQDISALARAVVETLSRKSQTLRVSESLTGGALSSAIVGVSGASKVFVEGLVTYSDRAKKDRLGVSENTLERFGAVSYYTAIEMAKGTVKDSDYAVSTTGIAGPKGDGVCDKVGAVFIGIATKDDVTAKGYLLNGDRDTIRENSVKIGLGALLVKLNRIKK